ncbi:MAG: LysR family transcriptional regulator [bacterium]|nr:LysR family transcriptional regulator [bacterium]
MELQQLRGFYEVAREGSFTRAAARLFLTQPAISQQVKALEEELGQALIVRGRRAVELTAAGHALYERTTTIFAELEGARQELDAMGQIVRGRVLLATSDTNCTYVLPNVLRRFRARYPEVKVDIRNKMSAEVRQLTLADQVDFGIVTLPARERGLRSEPLFVRGDVWICPPGHALAGRQSIRPATAGRFPLLALERGSQSRAVLDEVLQRAGVAPRLAMELGSIEIIKQFVEIDFGIALVPAVSVVREAAEGRLLTIGAQGFDGRSIGLVRHRGRPESPATAALTQMIREDLAGVQI